MPETRTDRTARERVERYRRGQRDQVRQDILDLLEFSVADALEDALERLGLAALMQLREAIQTVNRERKRKGVPPS